MRDSARFELKNMYFCVTRYICTTISYNESLQIARSAVGGLRHVGGPCVTFAYLRGQLLLLILEFALASIGLRSKSTDVCTRDGRLTNRSHGRRGACKHTRL